MYYQNCLRGSSANPIRRIFGWMDAALRAERAFRRIGSGSLRRFVWPVAEYLEASRPVKAPIALSSDDLPICGGFIRQFPPLHFVYQIHLGRENFRQNAKHENCNANLFFLSVSPNRGCCW
jgi:hypothetical protein